MPIPDLPTPALLVDLDRVDANLRHGQAYADEQGVALRPHTKTHKSPRFARAQVELGARGLCVAKLGEAELMAEAGLDDLFMPNTVVGADKARRAASLAQRLRFAIGADHPAQLEALSAAAAGQVRPLEVMVEVDTGARRGGAPLQAVPGLLQRVRDLPGLRARGLYSYEGYSYELEAPEAMLEGHRRAQADLVAVVDRCRELFDGPPVCSMGSTPSLLAGVPLQPGITEIRPGTYAFLDLQQAVWAGGVERSAAHVLATVVSVQPGRAILDAGSKSLTSDRRRGQDGHGLLVDHGLQVSRLSEEHGVVEGQGAEALRVGQKVRVLMNHVCPVVNLFDEMVLVRSGQVVEVLPVAGRGLLV